MKLIRSTIHSAGIGLIEVLATTVIVAVGLLAVATLQGDLIGGSRGNKTQAECMVLANSKIEQMRDTVQKSGAAGYNALTSSANSEQISGVTETFARSWTIANQNNPPSKRINVTVTWGNNANEQCAIQSIIAFDAPGNAMLAAKSAAQAGLNLNSPSTNAESSDDITETTPVPPSETPPVTGDLIAVDGKHYIVQDNPQRANRAEACDTWTPALTAFENNLYTRRVDFDGAAGNEAIELFEKITIADVDYCMPKIRYNGGVIIPIRGIVHSGATTGSGQNQTLLDVNLFTFNASESGTYCYFNPEANAKSAPYVCYIGGNCKFGPAGNDADGLLPTECPNPAVSASKVGPGGWRGKVGLLGVAPNGRNVCFAEEIAGSPATTDTARNYYSYNTGLTPALNEGINKPYSCHDFLIINGQHTPAQMHSECVAQADAIGGFILASKNIQRSVTSGDNVFDPDVDTAHCTVTGTSYTITGTITNANSAPSPVTVTDSVTANNCTATAASYTCQITTSASSVTISGIYSGQTKTCTLTPPSSSGCTLTFDITTNPTYTITGTVTGTSATAVNGVALPWSEIAPLTGSGNCTNNQNATYDGTHYSGTYTCSMTTAATSIELTASSPMCGAVSPSTAQTVTLPGYTATVTGPTFTASMDTTHTLSGNITIGNNVDANSTNITLTAAVDTNRGSCTVTGNHAANTTDTYSCTVCPNTSTSFDSSTSSYVRNYANNLTIAMSPACSIGGGSKKYTMTDGTTTTLGTGSLIINYDNVTGNTTKNITISKSNNNC